MNLTKTELAALGVMLITFIVSVYFYPQMPSIMATHWDLHGQVNGCMTKQWGLFIMPVILMGIVSLFMIIPRFAPLSVNIEKSRKYYSLFSVLSSVFILVLQYQVILWNLGIKINPLWVILVAAFSLVDIGIIWICREHQKKQ